MTDGRREALSRLEGPTFLVTAISFLLARLSARDASILLLLRHHRHLLLLVPPVRATDTTVPRFTVDHVS